MIFEQRSYTLIPGRLLHYARIYAAHGLPVTQRHGIELAAYFRNELGDLNQVVHFWRYESAAQRQEMRLPRDADPDWPAYQAMAAGNVLQQESRLLETTAYSPALVNEGEPDGQRTIVEMLTVTLAERAHESYVGGFGETALPAACAAGYRPLAFLVPVSGPLNEFVQLWYWPSQADRETAEAARARDPAWQKWRDDTAADILQRRRDMLLPMWFSPLQ